MKKIIVLALAVAIAVSCMIGVAFATYPGETVTISFKLNENPGFASLGAKIIYDTNALELVEIKQGAALAGGMFAGNPSNGMVSFVAMGSNITATGEMFTATFKVKEEAALGTYPITVDIDERATADASYNPVVLNIIGDDIKVTCNHSWSDWTVATAPGCTEDGLKERVCIKCGETENETVPALGHDYSAWEFDEEGHWHVCGNCGETADKAAHEKQWVIVKDSTHDEVGQKCETCKTCDWMGETVDTLLLGDLNGDGTVNPLDALLILQLYIGMINNFPIEN